VGGSLKGTQPREGEVKQTQRATEINQKREGGGGKKFREKERAEKHETEKKGRTTMARTESRGVIKRKLSWRKGRRKRRG